LRCTTNDEKKLLNCFASCSEDSLCFIIEVIGDVATEQNNNTNNNKQINNSNNDKNNINNNNNNVSVKTVTKFEGHSGSVTCIQWNLIDSFKIASCSYDSTVQSKKERRKMNKINKTK
jgi:WD40 repeat protein